MLMNSYFSFMKTLLLTLLGLSFSLSCFSQDPNPDLFGTWYLVSLSGSDIDGEIFVVDIEPSITPSLTIFENLEFQGVGACNDFLGLYGFANDQILVVDQFDNTDVACASDEQNDFEVSYFQNLVMDQTDLLYTISFGDQGDDINLLIENVLGGFLSFSNEPLNLDKANIVAVKMYPNPAQKTLF